MVWFNLVWFGHGFINCLASDLLFCPFHKKLRILEQKSCGFAKQIIRDLVSSCFVLEQVNPSLHVENLLDEIWKLVNLVSYVSQ